MPPFHIKAVLVETAIGRRSEIVIQPGQIGDEDIADTEIDILNTGAIAGHIEPEIVHRIYTETIEPLTPPESDFGSRLKDVAHFDVHLANWSELKIAAVFTPILSASYTSNKRVAISRISDYRCE